MNAGLLPAGNWMRWLVAGLNLALAVVQLAGFAPLVAEGRSVDWPGGSLGFLYRVDGLGLVFGVAWCLALAIIFATRGLPDSAGWPACLMAVALLDMAYAREPWVFYVGWEVAGAALWLALWATRRESAGGRLALVLNASGWPLLVALLLGLVPAFAPPVGGAAAEWPPLLAVALGVVALIRSGCWPFAGWLNPTERGRVAALSGLYALASPFVLAKALVAAPLGPLGIWALALLGSVGLLGGIAVLYSRTRPPLNSITSIYAAVGITGLGLASGSPLAAAGGVALLLYGLLWILPGRQFRYSLPLLLAASVPGLWLLAQGALDLGYGLVAAVVLPGLLLAIFLSGEDVKSADHAVLTAFRIHHSALRIPHSPLPTAHSILLWAFCLLLAVYPQGLVALAVWPAVQAIAGGVGALASLATDWGVWLSVSSPGQALLASLPATGIGVALLLALVVLHWLKLLSARFVRDGSEQRE